MNTKNKELAEKFLKEHGLYKNERLVSNRIKDEHGQVAAFSVTPRPAYIGRGHIVVASTEAEGERIFKEAYPDCDWNMAEVDRFEGKVVVWD